LTELQGQLDERQVVILVDEEARLWLVEKGYDATMGARPMERVIQEHIKKPLADLVLFGALSKGGLADVSVSEDRESLSIEVEQVEQKEPVEA
jgi:ATP-dependent Clp protease ATP-binding subunit ClpA